MWSHRCQCVHHASKGLLSAARQNMVCSILLRTYLPVPGLDQTPYPSSSWNASFSSCLIEREVSSLRRKRERTSFPHREEVTTQNSTEKRCCKSIQKTFLVLLISLSCRKAKGKYTYKDKFTRESSAHYTSCMIDGITIPTLPGYVSIREAADILGVSDKRVYQYVRAGRLSAQRIGPILILSEEEVRHFKPSPSGRLRTKAPPWRTYRSHGEIVVTDISVRVRDGQQELLRQCLRTIQETEQHAFAGTIARYVVKGDETLASIRILLIWKSTEMPDEVTRQQALAAFQQALDDVVDWKTAHTTMNECLIHT